MAADPDSAPPSPAAPPEARYCRPTTDGTRLVCEVCPRHCPLADGERGYCYVRQRQGERIVSTTYGRGTGFCIDPIEKKPLAQFYPGTAILSFGTPGCNLGCNYCQNWTMSRAQGVEAACEEAAPATIVRAAQDTGCMGVAFTYNDPIVWAEYAIDTAAACRAAGLRTVAVTSGYMAAGARADFFAVMDAANVDLKAFRDAFYREYCGGRLQPVLDTLAWVRHSTACWLEVTNLLIPGRNDSAAELGEMCAWLVAALGPDVPLHFSAFHPDFRLLDVPPTPLETLHRAYDIARTAGLRYVYAGNVHDPARQHTYCPACGRAVIEREQYAIRGYALHGSRCAPCGAVIAGRYGGGPGTWGHRRRPLRMSDYAGSR